MAIIIIIIMGIIISFTYSCRYAFHKEPPGGQDPPGKRKERLLQLFGHWNYNVVSGNFMSLHLPFSQAG